MNVFDLPEDTKEDAADDIIVAERSLANWERLSNALQWIVGELRDGRMALSPQSESRGILGPEVDGCVRIDVEALFVHVFPNAPSNSRRGRR